VDIPNHLGHTKDADWFRHSAASIPIFLQAILYDYSILIIQIISVAISTATSYLGGPAFETQPQETVILTDLFSMVFLGLSRQMLG
jgi:hypothetical protein